MSVRKLLLLTVCLLLIQQLTIGANVDSLLQIANGKQDTSAVLARHALSIHFAKVDLDTAISHSKIAAKLSDELNYTQGKLHTYLFLGGYEVRNGNYEGSLEWLNKGLKMIDAENLAVKNKINFLNNLGIAHYFAGNVGAAIEPYIEAIALCRANKLDVDRGRLLNNLGAFFRQGKRYKEAIEVYDESYELRTANKDTLGMANTLFNKSASLLKMKEWNASLEVINKAEAFYEKLNIPSDIFACKVSRGQIYVELEKMDEAFDELYPMTQMKELPLEPNSKLTLYLLLGEISNGKNKYKDALFYLGTIEKDIFKSDFKEEIARFYRTRAAAYLGLKKYQRYNDDYNKYIDIAEEQSSADKADLLSEMEAKYKSQEKDFEIELLNNKNELNKEQLKNTTLQRTGLIGILGILSAFFIYLFSLNKKISKKNEALQAANFQNKELMKEIHHRVKNNLQVMSSLLSLQARKTKNETTKIALNSSKSRVQAMSILHQNLYERQNFKELESRVYFLDLVDNIRDIYKFDDHIELETDLDSLILDVDTLVPMGLIANELICNAFKHAFTDRSQGKIIFWVKEQADGKILIKVKDNGVGGSENFLERKQQSSLGAKLIQSFAKSLRGVITIDQNNGSDISILMESPVKKTLKNAS